MDLLTKFTAKVYPSVEIIDNNVVEGYTEATGVQIRCFITEATATAIYERFEITTSRGAILYTTEAHASALKQGYTVECLGARYTIASPVTPKRGGTSIDHVYCRLEHID